MVRRQTGAVHALQGVLPPNQVVTDPEALITYNRDAGLDPGAPDGVALPTSTADVVRLVEWARKQRVALVARGAGTGLSGGAVAEHGGVIVVFSRMADVLAFDDLGGTVEVQPGLTSLELDNTVKQQGWYYPPDPSSGQAATLGGNIAENSGGPHCFKYGVTTNYVTGLEVVLADGSIIRPGGLALDYPQYDLLALLTGSEGTLGIISRASLRLIRNPPAVKTALASFNSVEEAGEAVSQLIAGGLVPATMEMMDKRFMRVIEDFSHAGLPVEAGAALIVEADGYPESLDTQMQEIETILRQHGAYELRTARDAEERARIWRGRKSAAGAIARLAPAYYLVDGTVPRSKLAAVLADVNAICEAHELRVVYVFHAGDGNLHPLILIEDPHNQQLVQQVVEAGRKIVARCVAEDGSITGEHGVGIEKREFMPLMYNAVELQAMQDMKEVFDPDYLMNPHKILPSSMPTPEPLPSPGTPPAAQQVAPRSAAEAAEAIHAWAHADQPMTIVGAGTHTSVPPTTPITISTSNLTGIHTLARDDLYVSVGAGTSLQALQDELAAATMWVPMLSPWQDSTVGGLIASNFNAPLRMRYGAIRDNVLSATVALPNGRTIRAGRPVVKNVAGYDLPRLFVGSYGTLGLLTEVTLKLAPLPRARGTLIAGVTERPRLPALQRAIQVGMKLLRLRLICSSLLLCPGNASGTLAPYALVYTAEGPPEDVETELAAVQRLLDAEGVSEFFRKDDTTGSQLWAATLKQTTAAPETILFRLGVAPGDLPHLGDALATRPDGSDTPPPIQSIDLASGLCYLTSTPAGVPQLANVRDLAHSLGGYSCAPLHAGSPDLDVWGPAPDSLPVMQRIKARWDAKGLLNPGRFIV